MRRWRFPRGERGSISVFVAVLAVALLAAAGLAVDGGRKVGALREASDLADNAARAGAQAVDLDSLKAEGVLRLDPDRAIQEAMKYLAVTGRSGTASVEGDTIRVTVSLTVRPVLLPIGPITVSATEAATAITEAPR